MDRNPDNIQEDTGVVDMQPTLRAVSCHDLPDEVLLHIFLCVLSEWASGWGPSWLNILWVCQRWSRVARGAPILWRKVCYRAETKPDFLETSLQRSDPLLVDVSFYTVPDLSVPATLLCQHLARIRLLHIVNPKKDDSGLARLIAQSMAHLEDLKVMICPKKYGTPLLMEDTITWAPRAEQFPNIQRLALMGVVVEDSFPLFPSLKRLELHDVLKPSSDIASFVQRLSTLPNLEELSIKNYRPRIIPVPSRLKMPQTVKSISIEDNAHYVKPFLSAFHFEPHVHLRVARALDYFDGFDPAILNYDFSTALSVMPLLPDDRTSLPILPLVTSVELRSRMVSKYKILGHTSGGDVVKIIGHLYEHPEREMLENMNLLNDIVDIFSAAPLVELRINGHSESMIEKRDWLRALRAFPNLERISVERTCANSPFDVRHTLFEALRSMRRAKGAPKDAARTPTAPRLKSLTLVTEVLDGDDEEFAEDLANTLEKRIAMGLPRLAELRIILQYCPEHLAERNLARKGFYVDALRDLVDELKFELLCSL
ncbi:hypothetical protein C8Q76DRAFT_752333 [Earliella scabrosa]|nr:hypothetical protein C8Q76DRAFT_752333 [Earliella scabrosa]